MESMLTVVVCIVVGLFVCPGLAYPGTSEEGRRYDRVPRQAPYSADQVLGSPLVNIKKSPTPDTVNVRPTEEKTEEKKELTLEKEDKSKITSSLSGAKMKVSFPEDSKQASKEDRDVVRSKKSASYREMSYVPQQPPHTTTVCIQVRSDAHSQVVCGPQVNEEKKEQTPPASARYAYQPTYFTRPYIQQEQLPLAPPKPVIYVRASPQESNSGRSSAAPQIIPAGQQMPLKNYQATPTPMSPKASVPGAARVPLMYPVRRTEDETNNVQPEEKNQQVVQPIRFIPQGPPPNSVVVHRQYYQAAPFSQGLIAPAPSPLRLNCALQPEGAQFIQPFGGSVVRSSTPAAYYPIGEQVITIPNSPSSRMADGSQTYYIDTQAKQPQQDHIVGSPYAPDYSAEDPWSSTYLGQDGRLYKIDNSQSRAATVDQMPRNMWEESQFLRSVMGEALGSMSMDELRSKSYRQEQALEESDNKLHQLQQQLKNLQQRAAVNEEMKKDAKKSHAGENAKETLHPSSQSTSEMEESKKPMNGSKRHT